MSYGRVHRIIGLINHGMLVVALGSAFYLIRLLIYPQEISGLKIQFNQEISHKSLLSSNSIETYASLLKDNSFRIKGEFRLLDTGSSHAEAPEISLVGTVSGGDYNYAIVVDSNGKQEIFKKGDNIYSIGRLKSVYKDKIVVNTPSGDRAFVIADTIIFIADTIIKEVKPEAGVTFSASSNIPVSPISSQIIRSSRNSFTISSDAVRQAIENPRDIMTHARFIPNIVDGRQEGFIIREIKKGGVYESLGLEEGDILLRINAFSITGPESALQAFTALKGMDRIELDIMRKGQKISITYQIK